MDLNYHISLKKLGCLTGLAVGDALGASMEFAKPEVPAYPTILHGPQTNIIGGGPFSVKPGQTTDDTQMAVCLAKGILENNMIFDENIVAKHYMTWYDDLFDGGRTTLKSIENLCRGIQPELSGYETWIVNEKKSSGNGSLMRTAPIAVAYCDQPLEVIMDISFRDSRITHFDFRCQLACAIYNCVLVSLINQTDYCLYYNTCRYLSEASELLLKKFPSFQIDILEAKIDLQKDIDAAFISANPRVYGEEPDIHIIRTQGFVRIAFRLALWHLNNTTSFESSMIDVINRGGDSDTNGAIVGAMLGAHYGVDGIPSRWQSKVEQCFSDGDTHSLWGHVYHPKHLRKLALK